MTLLELYKLKLYEYKETNTREKPWKLLAMLLLSEKDKYEPQKNSQKEFYEKYKKEINKQINKIEKDFNLTPEDIIKYIEKKEKCDNYEEQKIWTVFEDGFKVLNWGLTYKNKKTAEEIFKEYYDCDDFKRNYDIEQIAIANDISVTKLDDLLNKILDNPNEFFKKICDELTVEERNFILKKLENKSCMNCTNGNCRVELNIVKKLVLMNLEILKETNVMVGLTLN